MSLVAWYRLPVDRTPNFQISHKSSGNPDVNRHRPRERPKPKPIFPHLKNKIKSTQFPLRNNTHFDYDEHTHNLYEEKNNLSDTLPAPVGHHVLPSRHQRDPKHHSHHHSRYQPHLALYSKTDVISKDIGIYVTEIRPTTSATETTVTFVTACCGYCCIIHWFQVKTAINPQLFHAVVIKKVWFAKWVTSTRLEFLDEKREPSSLRVGELGFFLFLIYFKRKKTIISESVMVVSIGVIKRVVESLPSQIFFFVTISFLSLLFIFLSELHYSNFYQL